MEKSRALTHFAVDRILGLRRPYAANVLWNAPCVRIPGLCAAQKQSSAVLLLRVFRASLAGSDKLYLERVIIQATTILPGRFESA